MLFANYLTDTNEALLFLSYAIINQPKLNLQERPARHEVSAAEQGAARGAKESVLIGQDLHKRIDNPQADFRTGRSRSRDRDVSKAEIRGQFHARAQWASESRPPVPCVERSAGLLVPGQPSVRCACFIAD
jgi:hypothetical protein